jgi:hypothetical protein
MAEEKKDKKPSKGDSRYGKGPKIVEAAAKGDTEKSGRADKAASEAEKTASKENTTSTSNKKDPEPDGVNVEGADSKSVTMKDIRDRQFKEYSDMHKRHTKELDGFGTNSSVEE